LQGIGPYHQRFFAWETIAKSNNVDNFSKWLDGEEINSR